MNHRAGPFLVFAAVVATAACARAASPVWLENKMLAAALDPDFPRVIQYRHQLSGALFDGQRLPVSTVELDGQAEPYEVALKQFGPATANYRIRFPGPAIEITIRVTVEADLVELRMTDVREDGTARLRTLAFPGNALLTLSSEQPDAAIATVYATSFEPPTLQRVRERMGPLAEQKAVADTGNYFFASAGQLAVGLAGNHISDCDRTTFTITEENGVKTCTAQNPVWQYREVENETLPLPWVRVFITGDRNGDGKATWQDAALVYREVMPKPFGWEHVRKSVGDQVA